MDRQMVSPQPCQEAKAWGRHDLRAQKQRGLVSGENGVALETAQDPEGSAARGTMSCSWRSPGLGQAHRGSLSLLLWETGSSPPPRGLCLFLSLQQETFSPQRQCTRIQERGSDLGLLALNTHMASPAGWLWAGQSLNPRVSFLPISA